MRWPGRSIVLATVLVLGAGMAGYATSYEIREHQDAAPRPATPAPSPPALASAIAVPIMPASSAAPVPSVAGLSGALARALADPRLGSRLLAEVQDPATGATLLRRGGLTPAAPASTAKIATAVALLTVHTPTDRLSTRIVAGTTVGTVVLVGGGDPTLSAARVGTPTRYAGAARIADLASQLRAAGVVPTRVLVDTSLFAGPAVSPNWAGEDVPSSYAAPITAAMLDGARDAPSTATRSVDPAGAAGRALARELGVPPTAVGVGRATAAARALATVQSPPLSAVVEQMLEQSDNVIAECLARQVALATGAPPSFDGAATAVRTALARFGVDIGAGMVDGSGLAASDRLTPATLAALLRLAVTQPTLGTVLAGLPVAGWTGTLANRFLRSSALGVVRAKTGTLTSVSTLAGVVHDKDGRLLSFVLIADRVGPTHADTVAAQAALDAVATALAGCGCG